METPPFQPNSFSKIFIENWKRKLNFIFQKRFIEKWKQFSITTHILNNQLKNTCWGLELWMNDKICNKKTIFHFKLVDLSRPMHIMLELGLVVKWVELISSTHYGEQGIDLSRHKTIINTHFQAWSPITLFVAELSLKILTQAHLVKALSFGPTHPSLAHVSMSYGWDHIQSSKSHQECHNISSCH